jgi:hypothetical protein
MWQVTFSFGVGVVPDIEQMRLQSSESFFFGIQVSVTRL